MVFLAQTNRVLSGRVLHRHHVQLPDPRADAGRSVGSHHRVLPGPPQRVPGRGHPQILRPRRQLWEQYVTYIGSVFRLDFGISTVQFPEPTASLLFYAAHLDAGPCRPRDLLRLHHRLVHGHSRRLEPRRLLRQLLHAHQCDDERLHAGRRRAGAVLCLLAAAQMVSAGPRARSEPRCPTGSTSSFIGSVLYHATLPVHVDPARQLRRLAPGHAQRDDQSAQRGFRHPRQAPRA